MKAEREMLLRAVPNKLALCGERKFSGENKTSREKKTKLKDGR